MMYQYYQSDEKHNPHMAPMALESDHPRWRPVADRGHLGANP